MPAAKTKPDNKDFMKQAQAGLAIARASLVVAGSYPMAKTDPEVDTQSASSLPKRDNGQPTEEEMIRINALSRSGNLDPASLYALDAAISNQRIDSYLTRMDITTLENYVAGAMRGVPVQYSHQTRVLPLGRSYYGVLDDDPQLPGQKRALASAYLLRNNSANSMVNSNEVIASIDSGVTADVSVGFEFFPGTPEKQFQDRTWYRCSICGGDFLAADWWDDDPDDCHHWPGELYRFDGGQQEQMCYLDVVNGYLAEFSPVYAGATDGAVILKAQRAAADGVLNRSQIMHLEEAYRTRLLDRTIQTLPAIKPKAKTERNEKDMAATKAQLEAAALDGQKRALASLVKHVMDSRAMDDTEMALCQKAMDHIAAGEVDMANDCLGQLMAPATYESTDDESRAEGDAEPGQTMGLDDVDTETASDMLSPDLNQNDDLEGAGDQEPEGRSMDITLLSLTAKERRQFTEIKEQNELLRKQIRTLEPLAEDGKELRARLIAEVARQAGRADMGGLEDPETAAMLKPMSIRQLEKLYTTYRQIGDSLLGHIDEDGTPLLMGGRQTIAMDPNTPAFAQGVMQGAANRAAERKDYGSYR